MQRCSKVPAFELSGIIKIPTHGLLLLFISPAFVGVGNLLIITPFMLSNADLAGLADRYKTTSGNAFEVDWGNNYDLILLPNILHHFDQDGCVHLLGKAKDSLSIDGSVFLIDIIPNPDRVSPPEQAAFALFMLATTPKGDAYTCAEFETMARTAELTLVDSMQLLPTPQTLLEFKILSTE